MRSQKSIKNFIYSVIGNMINILITFISRTFFITLLGNEYLGINGLFSNILNLLSLAELGVGTAITYCLYKPLATKDIKKINALMNFYKLAYRVIGITIIVIGLLITPFIGFFISEIPNIKGLHTIFVLFVLNTASSYLFSYKRTLISADQKQYIVSLYQYIFFLAQNIIQIIILVINRNYILYLIIQLIVTILHNIFISSKANKLYPYLRKKNIEKIDREALGVIKKNVKAMFFHKIGSMVVNSTDNILISKLISINVVGIFSNYSLIINAVNGILVQIFSSITASVGNLGSTENEERVFDIFNKILFLNFWVYSFTSICLITLLNPFIELWIGSSMKLPLSIIIVMVFNFFLSGMRKTTLTFRDALGLYWHDRYKPVAESIINLVFSLILARKYGLIGIFLGTTISTIITSFWIEPYILYKYGFSMFYNRILDYFKKMLLYTNIMIVILIININVCNYIIMTPIVSFITKTLISIILPNLILLILFYKNNEFLWLKNIVVKLILRLK